MGNHKAKGKWREVDNWSWTSRNKGVEVLEQLTAILKKIPGMPENPTIIGSGSDRLKLSWRPPKHNPQAVEDYVVSIREQGKEWKEVARTKKTRALIKGLESKTEYVIQVVATSSIIEEGGGLRGLCKTKSKVATAAEYGGAGVLFAPVMLGTTIMNKSSHYFSTAEQVGVYLATIPLSFLVFPVTMTVSAVMCAKEGMENVGDLTPVKED